ncbi:MAG: nuclear transport factor 2 family protein [bacterium]
MTTIVADELIARYFDAWNRYAGDDIGALFALNGTFSDPSTSVPVRPGDFFAVVEALRAPFPDYRFEAGQHAVADRHAYVEWTLTGTNSVSLKPGVDPTGKAIHVRGIEHLEWSNDGLVRATRYFDRQAMYEQIGMQTIIEPKVQGKATFGYSKRVASGNENAPGCFGITWIAFRDQAEIDRIRQHASHIIDDFLDAPGFISLVTGAAGERAFTVSAWEDEAALERALTHAHARAKHEFRTGDLAPAVWTSVWQPVRVNAIWVRCAACHHPSERSHANVVCTTCGATLPEQPTYW